MVLSSKPHAVLLPFPAQSHIKGLLKFAKLLHHRGFHITFVNTEFNHDRFLRSQGSDSLDVFPDFRFEAIPDGLPPSDPDATQDIFALIVAIKEKAMSPPLIELVKKLNAASSASNHDGIVPPVSCIISDGFMPFALDAAQELGVPSFFFFTVSATTLLSMKHFGALIEKGLIPLKDESYLINGYLETIIDWIPGIKEIRLKDLSSFIRTTDPNSILVRYLKETAEIALDTFAIIIHTFEALEQDVLKALSSIYPRVYTISPLQLLHNRIPEDHDPLRSAGYSLWKEEEQCLKWLDMQEPNSVLYINFGSIVVMSEDQLVEFAMGLVDSDCQFLWIIRPDMLEGENEVLTKLLEEQVVKEKGFMASWCAQEQVLNHKSVGGFVTHCGWNSVVESLTAGVPMLCWPCMGDQQTNAWFVCGCLGVGMEIESDAKHEDVTTLVKALMEGEKSKEITQKVREWKRSAHEAVSEKGSSLVNLDSLVDQILGHMKN